MYKLLIFAQVLLFFNDCVAITKIHNKINNPSQVIITANLKGIGFDKVPIDFLIKDFIAKKSITFDSVSYDSINGAFKGIFTINKPQLMLFFLKEVYVTPGDSVNLKYIILINTDKIYKDTLIISGTHQANYQYYTFTRNEYLVSAKDFPRYNLPFTKGSFNTYKNELTIYFSKLKERVIGTLKGTNYTIEYKQFVLNDLYNYWAYNYLVMYFKMKEPIPDRNKRIEIRNHLIVNADTNSNAFFRALLMFHKVASNVKSKSYDLKEFKNLEKDALAYPSFLKDYLLTSDIIDFINNKRVANVNLILALNKASRRIGTPKYQRKISQYNLGSLSVYEKLPQKLNTIKLIDLNNRVFTLGDIISNNINNIIYIDFWASWCLPCRNQTLPLKKMHDAFKNKPIKYIQISVDIDNYKWQNASKEDDVTFAENYRFINHGDYLKFSNLLEFIPIPYYLIIDKVGNIAIKNAPRPSQLKEVTKIINKLNISQVEVK